jgi:hypothetical protein
MTFNTPSEMLKQTAFAIVSATEDSEDNCFGRAA